LTPREFESLSFRRRNEREGEDYRTAAIVCATYNVWRDPKSDPITPEDILGKKKAKSRQSPEDMLLMVQALHKSFGGKDPVG